MSPRIALSIVLILGVPAVAVSRIWTSADGAFKEDAELVESRADGTLLLKRADGQLLQVPLGKLSADDQQYVRHLPPGGGRPNATPVPLRPNVVPFPQANLRPVPTDDEVAKQLKEIRKLLDDDYQQAQSKPGGRKQLSEKLTNLARESLTKDPVAAYAMASEAVAVAAEGGHLADALTNIDWLSGQFSIRDVQTHKLAAVRRIKIDSLAADSLAGIYEQLMSLMNESEDGADHATSLEFGRLAMKIARRSKDAALIAQIQGRGARLAEQREMFDAAAKAIKALSANSKDPAASAALGQFLCLARGKFDEGLPRLAAGDDTELAALAKKDLAQPATPKEQAELADAWWALAESPNYKKFSAPKKRAAYWYQQAAPQLTGLDKLRAENRIAATAPPKIQLADAKAGDKAPPAADNAKAANEPAKPEVRVPLSALRMVGFDNYVVFNEAGNQSRPAPPSFQTVKLGKARYNALAGVPHQLRRPTLVAFNANKEYVTIQGTVFNNDELARSVIQFTILADKKVAWQGSAGPRGQTVNFQANIAGARVIQFAAEFRGGDIFEPVWANVTLTKKAD